MKKSTILSAATLLALSFSVAGAQQLYITGEITTPNWNPGTGVFADTLVATTEFADLTATEGVLTQKTIAAADHGIAQDTRLQYKLASTGFADEIPGSNISQWLIMPDNSLDFTIYVDRTDPQDGFTPANDFVYTSATAEYIASVPKIALVGSFYDALLGITPDPSATPPVESANWTPESADNILLTNAGSGATDDGLYGATFTGVPPGTYEFLILLDSDEAGAFDRKIAEYGMSGNGANIGFTVVDSTDNITVLLDATTARWKVENDNPTLSAGPPFYAFFKSNDDTDRENHVDVPGLSSLGEDTVLIDNGDYYARAFTIADAGNYSVQIRQGVGPTFPATGSGYPFTTTAANQEVVVIFDRQTYTDGYNPVTDFVVVLGEEASGDRSFLNSWDRVQVVGPLSIFGVGDFDNPEALANLSETTAGSQIYELTEVAAFAGTSKQVKAVLSRTGVAVDAAPTNDWQWNVQAGGITDGLNVTGDNTAPTYDFDASTQYTFKVDAVTGRMGVGSAVTKNIADPDRSAEYFAAQAGNTTNVSVSDWQLF